MHLIASDVSAPSDSYEYSVTVAGAEFSGAGPTPSGYVMCGDARFYGSGDHLAGRFSADGNTLTAYDELSFQVTSGDFITYHFECTATKQ